MARHRLIYRLYGILFLMGMPYFCFFMFDFNFADE
nr:MAG TPA: Protein of unknown function (DUF3930) [Caudoviricetes sp.]